MAEILPIIARRAGRGAVMYSDGFKTYDGLADFGYKQRLEYLFGQKKTYDGLADFGYKQHYRIKHSDNQFAHGHNHINGIENFWGLCKVRLAHFRGIHKHKFYLHLKECEFRFNMRDQNMYQYLLTSIRKRPLTIS